MTRELRANWRAAILVCAKCSRKLGGGFGPKGKAPLAKALRRRLGVTKGRRAAVGVAEVKCLGVCPRDAVTVLDAAAPGRWLLVPPGTDLDELVADLAPPGDSPVDPGPESPDQA